MTNATFILSLDCEGKWGYGDVLEERKFLNTITQTALLDTYQMLVDLLEKYDIDATFAFTGAFTLSREALNAEYKSLSNLPSTLRTQWFQNCFIKAVTENYNGWLGDACLAIVQQAKRHEIAYHGHCHVPLDCRVLSADVINDELAAMQRTFNTQGLTPTTFVYPRNIVSNTNQLSQFGIVGYRNMLKPYNRSLINNLKDFVFEFQPALKSQPHSKPSSLPRAIPSGHLLNFPYGFRKLVPHKLTIARWKQALRHAINHQQVVHLWSHPHTFIFAPNSFNILEEILSEVSNAAQAGHINTLTQAQYSHQ